MGPVLQEFACMVLSWGTVLPRNIQATGRVIKAAREERLHKIEPLPITPEARSSFEDATGIPVEEQRALEQAFRALGRHGSKEKTHSVDQPATWWQWHWSAASTARPQEGETPEWKSSYQTGYPTAWVPWG